MSATTSAEVGCVYYRKAKSWRALVIRVLAVGEWIEYQTVHAPASKRMSLPGRCKAKNFTGWHKTAERDDYSDLDGCKIFSTFLVLDTAGQPILRCSQKRADFYLKKNLARTVREGVLQFTDGQTESRLRELYPGPFSDYFLAVKNDRCVVCATANNLTRHHVIPQRHKAKIPLPWRRCLSNVLFVCRACHERYETTPEPDPAYGGDWQDYARRWQQHFVFTLRPRHLPEGWEIISVKNLDALRDRS